MAGAGYCPTCGTDRRQGDRFCRNCGRDFGGGATAEDEITEAGIHVPAGEPTRPLETVSAASSSVASLPPPPPMPPVAAVPPATSLVPPAAVVPSSAPHPRAFHPVALAGSVALLVSLALPWVQGGGGTYAFDIPIQFLWDFRQFDGAVKVGFVVSALGILAALLCFFAGTGWVRRICGSLVLIVAVAFVAQIFRGVDAFGGTLADLLDTLGAGVYVTAAGAIALQVSR